MEEVVVKDEAKEKHIAYTVITESLNNPDLEAKLGCVASLI